MNGTLACNIVTTVQARLGPGGMDPSTWQAAEAQVPKKATCQGPGPAWILNP